MLTKILLSSFKLNTKEQESLQVQAAVTCIKAFLYFWQTLPWNSKWICFWPEAYDCRLPANSSTSLHWKYALSAIFNEQSSETYKNLIYEHQMTF